MWNEFWEQVSPWFWVWMAGIGVALMARRRTWPRKQQLIWEYWELALLMGFLIEAFLKLNAEWFICILVVGSGSILLLQRVVGRGLLKKVGFEDHWLWLNARELFPIFLLVLLLRTFAYEGFRIPSESLEPTLQVGDFVAVNKYVYGLRLPVVNTTLWPNQKPRRGDVVVFRFPQDEQIYYVKRVIGLPGDDISYIDKTIYINGKAMPQKNLRAEEIDETLDGDVVSVSLKEEDLGTLRHKIHLRSQAPARNLFHQKVPEGAYFVMGDNRDGSYDSRSWGYVPETLLVGRVEKVLLSWDDTRFRFRRGRFWYPIQGVR